MITPTVLLTAGIAANNGQPETAAQSPVTLASTTGSLLLTVLDDNDEPVPGANVKVRVRQVFMGPDTYSHHHTDHEGRLKVQVPDTTPHYFSAKVEVAGHAPFLAAWENRESPDPIPAEYTVWLDPGRIIGGIVRTTEGFRYIRAAQLRPGEENVVVMSRETFVESRVLKVSGRVVDAETNAPIARFRVTPGYQREARGRTIWLHGSQSKGRSGAYRRAFTRNDFVSQVHAIALLVEADGYKPTVVQQVVAAKSDFKADVALDKADDADYRVLTPSGEAAAGATVAVCTPKVGPIIENGTVIPNSTCERTNADASGRFSIMPQDGLFALMVLHESGAVYITQQELGKSHTISLKPWARVEGTLRMRGQLAANESIRLDRADSATMNGPKIHYQYNTTTDENGKFSFEKVVPESGQVARVAVTQLGGGMSSSTPTIVSDVIFVPGETTNVELGRTGRQIVGNLAFPGGANSGNDWRLAMISLQSRPKDMPTPPTPPIPEEIDPVKDRDAAMAWWDQWQHTEQGKQFQKDMKRYQEAMQGFKPTHYSARVAVEGSFSFEDIPAGDYQISVQAVARPAGGGVGHGDVIGTLQHTFTVPKPIDESSTDPVDLGEVKVKAVEQQTQRP